MLGVTHWGRQIRFLLGLTGSRRYSALDVQKYLRGGAGGSETLEIEQVVSRLPAILGDPRVRRRYDGFQRYVEVLPRILFLYHRGTPAETITNSLSFMATDIGVETVVQITAQVVADHLNRAA